MSWFTHLHLMRLFSLYLLLMFLLGVWLRVHLYNGFLRLAQRFPARWPRLLRLIRQHGTLFVTGGTLYPLVWTLGLWVMHTTALYLIWPHANLTLGRLLDLWPAIPLVLGTGAAMMAWDLYNALDVGKIDLTEAEKYLDQAEYWLEGWRAPAVTLLTFGWVNPRKIVHREVRNALDGACRTVNLSLWRVVVQTGLRLAYGLSLWLTWAVWVWRSQGG